MSLNDFLEREARKAKRAAFADRFFHAFMCLAAILLFGFGFTVFGYAAVSIPQDAGLGENTQTFMVYTMTFLAIVNICISGYFMFRFLDECFLSKDDTRRITGTRH